MNIPKSVVSTFLHTVELTIVLAVVLTVAHYFPNLLPSDLAKGSVIAIVGCLVALARKSDSSPVPDYVNKPKV